MGTKCHSWGVAQRKLQTLYADSAKISVKDMSTKYLNIGDSIFIVTGICKNKWIFFDNTLEIISIKNETKKRSENAFIKVHGNVTYNFSYRSRIDTPFAQNDLAQHLVQSNFNFVIKDKYPVMMTITNRNSNSPSGWKCYLSVNYI